MRSITGKPARGAEYSKDEGGRMKDEDRLLIQVAAIAKFDMSVKSWIKKLGFWGFLFFLLKGLLWLTIPVLIAMFAD
jgi:hypothetical protein